jgi:hypothetical protein
MKYGARVKITYPADEVRGLAAVFHGKTGTVIDVEKGRPTMFRVRLDEPVRDPVVGLIRDDLWAREYLRRMAR